MSFILPGDPSVPWSSFENTMDRKVVIIQENNIRKQVGFTTEQITEEVYESKKMIKRIQTLKSDLLGDVEAISIISKKPCGLTGLLGEKYEEISISSLPSQGALLENQQRV